MSAALLPALRRNLVLFAFAFVAAAMVFGSIMLTSPPISEAAVIEAGQVPAGATCEYVPILDVMYCTVQN